MVGGGRPIHPSIHGYRMGGEGRGAIMARDRSKNTPSSRARFVLESFSLGFFVSPPIVANYCAQYRRGCFCFCFFARKVRKNCSPVPLFEMIRVEFFDVSTFLLWFFIAFVRTTISRCEWVILFDPFVFLFPLFKELLSIIVQLQYSIPSII